MESNEIKAAYQRRRKRQLIVALFLVPTFLGMLFLSSNPETSLFGLDYDTLGKIAFGIVICALAYSVYNWRCPGCRKYLGRSINQNYCARGGAKFK
ncbi:MAG: hypothetical protein GC180_01750 [Bacteroidetes bacterium]|nr:hypothetical protein [Bacteroidota bacterium]